MIKRIIFISLFIFYWGMGIAQFQLNDLEKLRNFVTVSKQDTNVVWAGITLSQYYNFINLDSAIYFGQKALDLSREMKFPVGEAKALYNMSINYRAFGNFPKAQELQFKSLQVADKNNLIGAKALALKQIGAVYRDMRNYQKAIFYYYEVLKLSDRIQGSNAYALTLGGLTFSYMMTNKLDSAEYYANRMEDYIKRYQIYWFQPDYKRLAALIQLKKGDPLLALDFLHQGLIYYSKTSTNDNVNSGRALMNLEIAKVFKQITQIDSAIYYAQKSFDESDKGKFNSTLVESGKLLSELNEKRDLQKSYEYSKKVTATLESVNNFNYTNAVTNLVEFDEKERQYEIEKTRTEFRNRLRVNAFLGSTFTLIIIAIFLFILSRRKQKAKQKIEAAFTQLKFTQTQLIQSEKMASLGELTAGIAHEIQNPLNFVNNFSDLNAELIDELKGELAIGNQQSANEIADDIKENEQKINHHGKRAEAIVKGMLLHSRGTSGQKELTDINALCDEYLRLSYHGFRAKDKSFNVDFKFEPDKTLPKIEIVPQDIGRVVLNLINNAFYAVDKKAKELTPQPPKGGLKNVPIDYKPEVIVSTSYLPPSGGMRGVIITVKDNGPGIPDSIKEKIFQPFFTTKPTGQGTGLGLSLSYDIVKAHGGEIKVMSKESEGTEFIIHIPTV